MAIMISRRTALGASLAVAGLAAGAATLLPGTALAADLDSAKAQGYLGERIDGYLGVVDPNAPADVKDLAQRTNAQRKERYAEIAASRNVPVEAVAQIAGAKLIEKAPAGEFVMDSSGTWKRK